MPFALHESYRLSTVYNAHTEALACDVNEKPRAMKPAQRTSFVREISNLCGLTNAMLR